jgi:hypothetical protein
MSDSGFKKVINEYLDIANMKKTKRLYLNHLIPFPSFIDGEVFEYVGYYCLPPKLGWYGIRTLDTERWYEKDWTYDFCSDHKFFCFRKINKINWPKCFKDGARLYNYQGKAWFLEGCGFNSTVECFNNALAEEYQIDTSKLDKSKTYIKGED